jgi:hypothetical protein
MMIRDANGHPLALPLAKLPAVPLARDPADLRRHLRSAPDPLYAPRRGPADASTAQALLRRYVDDNITQHTKRAALNAALDAVNAELPHWAHEVAVTRQIYNLPPFDIARRTRANVRAAYPACPCVKCAEKRPAPRSDAPRSDAPRSDAGHAPRSASPSSTMSVVSSGTSSASDGSSHTHVSYVFSDADDIPDDPPPPYSAIAPA